LLEIDSSAIPPFLTQSGSGGDNIALEKISEENSYANEIAGQKDGLLEHRDKTRIWRSNCARRCAIGSLTQCTE